MLQIVYPKCAGIDVHKKFVTVSRITGNGRKDREVTARTYSTMTDDLEALAAWLAEGGVTHVAMESTGVFWQPVYNILESQFTVYLVNAQAVKRMPGRKTDMTDAAWLATLMEHGLLQASFIPNRSQRELRELTRYRQSLVEEHSRFANRLQKVLEGTNLKLSSVASKIQGVSAQAILHALLEGQTDTKVLAELAQGRLRTKRDQLERALKGKLTPHQHFMLSDLFIQLEFLDERIAAVEVEIESLLAQLPAFEEAVGLLDTIPGVNRMAAATIVAEIGVDMSRFPSDRHLTAWAGVAPGNHESGGKQLSGKARRGNKYLRRILTLAARAASSTKDTYLRSMYYRLKARRGGARASLAVGRTILQMAYHMIQRHQEYIELGANYLDSLDKVQLAKRLVKRLENLGFDVQAKQRDDTTTLGTLNQALA
jgi:transposase